jgi:hypothetical protein
LRAGFIHPRFVPGTIYHKRRNAKRWNNRVIGPTASADMAKTAKTGESDREAPELISARFWVTDI